MGVKIDLSGVPLKCKRITSNRKVGLFIASTFEKHMAKFVPLREGGLRDSATTEPFRVIYHAEYSHYQYTGKNFNFYKLKNENAGAYWDRRMYINKNKQISREITNYIRKGGF